MIDTEKLDADISRLSRAAYFNHADVLCELRTTGTAPTAELAGARAVLHHLDVQDALIARNVLAQEVDPAARPLTSHLLDDMGEVEVFRAGRAIGTFLPLQGIDGDAWRAFTFDCDAPGIDAPSWTAALEIVLRSLDIERNLNGSVHVEGEAPGQGWVDVDLHDDEALVAFLTELGALPLLRRLFSQDYRALAGAAFIEARCTGCGETFLPHDEHDDEHGECGAAGIVQGAWA